MSAFLRFHSHPDQEARFARDVREALFRKQMVLQVTIDRNGRATFYIVPHTYNDWTAIASNLREWININRTVFNIDGSYASVLKYLNQRGVENIDLRIRKEFGEGVYERDYVHLCVLNIDEQTARIINTDFGTNNDGFNGIVRWSTLSDYKKSKLCKQLVLERDRTLQSIPGNAQVEDGIRFYLDNNDRVSADKKLYVMTKPGRGGADYSWVGGKTTLDEYKIAIQVLGDSVNVETKFRAAALYAMIREFGEELNMTPRTTREVLDREIVNKFRYRNQENQIEYEYTTRKNNIVKFIFADYSNFELRYLYTNTGREYIESRLPVIVYSL
jgi:hypothetical protein